MWSSFETMVNAPSFWADVTQAQKERELCPFINRDLFATPHQMTGSHFARCRELALSGNIVALRTLLERTISPSGPLKALENRGLHGEPHSLQHCHLFGWQAAVVCATQCAGKRMFFWQLVNMYHDVHFVRGADECQEEPDPKTQQAPLVETWLEEMTRCGDHYYTPVLLSGLRTSGFRIRASHLFLRLPFLCNRHTMGKETISRLADEQAIFDFLAQQSSAWTFSWNTGLPVKASNDMTLQPADTLLGMMPNFEELDLYFREALMARDFNLVNWIIKAVDRYLQLTVNAAFFDRQKFKKWRGQLLASRRGLECDPLHVFNWSRRHNLTSEHMMANMLCGVPADIHNLVAERKAEEDRRTTHGWPDLVNKTAIDHMHHLMETPERHLSTEQDAQQLIHDISSGVYKSIVVFTGAVVSAAAGIENFQSKDSAYSRIIQLFPEVSDPSAIFAEPFASQHNVYGNPHYLDMEQRVANAEPTMVHRLCAWLNRKGWLRRVYTETVDGLHLKVGLDPIRLVEFNGSMRDKSVVINYVSDPRVLKQVDLDFRKVGGKHQAIKGVVDLVLVIGSHLQAAPFCVIPNLAPRGCTRVYLNHTLHHAINSLFTTEQICQIGGSKLHAPFGSLWEHEQYKDWKQSIVKMDPNLFAAAIMTNSATSRHRPWRT